MTVKTHKEYLLPMIETGHGRLNLTRDIQDAPSDTPMIKDIPSSPHTNDRQDMTCKPYLQDIPDAVPRIEDTYASCQWLKTNPWK